MPNINLGNDSISGMSLTGLSNNTFYGILVGSAVSDGTLQSITVYVKDFNSLGPFDLNVALYDATGANGRPGNRLTTPDSAVVADNHDDWLTVNLSTQEYEIANGTAYWVCFGFEPDKIPQAYNTAGTAELSVYGTGSLDDPWGGGGPVDARMAGFLTYEEGTSADNIFGNALVGIDGNLGLPDEDMFGHFDYSRIASQWDADVPACVVTKLWVYARGRSGFDPATLRIAVYDASNPTNDNWTVEVESPAFTITADDAAKWYSVDCSLVLTAGKKALAIISYDGHDTSANIYYNDKDGPTSGDIVTFISSAGAFEDPLGSSQGGLRDWSIYAEYIIPSVLTTPGNLYAQVDAIPVIPTGRNVGFSSGHDPKYVLDNNPGTWWMPDDFGTNSLYIDLGSIQTVDALSIWLHNYNESYDIGGKTWTIAYSDDDSSYISLAAVTFDHEYNAVVLQSFEPTEARYWRVTFDNFDATPQGPRPEISALWILNDYSLPWAHQRPEDNKLLFRNNVTTTRSGHRFSSDAGVGMQRLIERRFVLTKDNSQWTNLLNAYKASRGQCLPIMMQSELGSNVFYALTFNSPLAENRHRHEYREPRMSLREIGFERVPFNRRIITPTANTLALWRFRDDFTDDSGNGHDWSFVTNGPETYERGTLEQGNSVIDLSGSTYLTLSTVDAGDFHMGTNNFSAEVWCRMNSGSLQQLIRNSATDYSIPAGGWFLGMTSGHIRAAVSDGSVQVGSSGYGPIVDDGEWHLLSISIDRTNDELRVYTDGVNAFTHDISAITGNIEYTPLGLFTSSVAATTTLIDEIHVVKGHAFTNTEMSDRYAETAEDFGNWGM